MDISKKKIILVEDEAIIAMHEKQELEKYGYSVHHVINGEDAVTSVLDSDSNYDLILMDIDLGSGIDGTQAAEQVLQHKDIPVVFLSSHTNPEVVEKTEKITSYGYVVKNSGIVVLDASIKMAFKLFEAKKSAQKNEDALRESEATIRKKLKAITEPEGDIGTLELADIIDHQELQTLMEDFYNLTGIGGAILDISGNILVGVAWQEICSKFHRVHPDTLKNCLASDLDLTRGVPVGTCKAYHCKNNMWDIVTPVMVEEKHLGNIFIGQFFFEDEVPDYELFKKQARQYGFDETEYLAALDRVPRFSRETVDRAMAFYSRLADMISSLGYTTIKLSRNIVRHKQAEEALKASRDLLDATQSIARVGGWQWDVERQAMTWADQTYRIHGFEPGEFKAGSPEHIQRSIACYDPEDRPKIESAFRKCVEEGEDYSLEFSLTTSQGGRIWVQTSAQAVLEGGRVVKVIGHIMDITERKQAEIELKEKTDLLEKIFNNNIDLIALTDLEGNFTHAGKSHEILGYDIDYLIGKNVMDFVHPEDVSFVSTEFRNFLLSENKPTVEYRYKRIDGTYLWFETIGTILKDTNGNPEQILFTTRDITERRQAEEEIKRQLEEKEIFLREVHHRIKNNVNSIESLLSMQARSTDNSEVILALQESISRVQSIRVLYDKLLIGKDYRDVSIRSYIESLIDSLVAVYPESKNVTIEKKITDFTLNSRKVIPVGIIINELLTNIFKYAFNGRHEGHILVELDKTETHVTLTIQDNGIGIDEGVVANKSPGFGLTIVGMLAQQLKGTYTVKNKKGTISILQFEI